MASGQVAFPLPDASFNASSETKANVNLGKSSPTPSIFSSVGCPIGIRSRSDSFRLRRCQALAAFGHSIRRCINVSIGWSQCIHLGLSIKPNLHSRSFVYTSPWAIRSTEFLCLVLVNFLILVAQFRTSPGCKVSPDLYKQIT